MRTLRRKYINQRLGSPRGEGKGGKPARVSTCRRPRSCRTRDQSAYRRGEALLCHDGWPPLEAVEDLGVVHLGPVRAVAFVEEFGARCREKVLSSDAWGEVVGERTALFFGHHPTHLYGGREYEGKRCNDGGGGRGRLVLR